MLWGDTRGCGIQGRHVGIGARAAKAGQWADGLDLDFARGPFSLPCFSFVPCSMQYDTSMS